MDTNLNLQEKLKSGTQDSMVALLSSSSLHSCFVLSPHKPASVTFLVSIKENRVTDSLGALNVRAQTDWLSTESKILRKELTGSVEPHVLLWTNQLWPGSMSWGKGDGPPTLIHKPHCTLAEMDAPMITCGDCINTRLANLGEAEVRQIGQVFRSIPTE